MTDTSETPDGQQAGNGESGDQAGGAGPTVHALAQYVKDLSFENPRALDMVAGGSSEAPQVSFSCDVTSQQVSADTHEVTLKLECRAVRQENTMFLSALDYAGLFRLANVPADHVEAVVMIHCPTLLFPFARAIMANTTREGGYPALLIDMVDFSQIYFAKKAAAEGETATPGESPDQQAQT